MIDLQVSRECSVPVSQDSCADPPVRMVTEEELIHARKGFWKLID